MATNVVSDRATAMRLVGEGDLSGAIRILGPLVEASGEPEERIVLGTIAYIATDYGLAQAQFERAYRDLQARGLPRRAAIAATALARLFVDGLEDQVVGRGWLARALRLLEHEEPCVEKGYVLVGMVGASVENAEELEANAHRALDIAHRFQDRDLECKALGDAGLALVSMGRIQDGMAHLDEAFTMIAGGDCKNPSIISQVMCGMLSACDRCGDVQRAESWLRFREKSSGGAANHTFAHCLSAFGSLLCQLGRWQEAETALRLGLSRGETSFRHTRLTARAALADLWIRQGRLDEAALLIDPDVDRVEIMGPRARLHLARRQWELAAAVAGQALRQLTGDQLRAAPLLLVLVDAELGRGNTEAAGGAAMELQRLADASEVPALAAQAALGLGKTAAAKGDLAAAAKHFDIGLGALAGSDWPILRAALHLELARAHAPDAPPLAVVDGQAALAIYQRVGAPEAADAAKLLRSLGIQATAGASQRSALDVLSRREREVLQALAQGLSNPEIAKRLFITAKTAEHHVSSILSKLGLRNRAEAAAFAASFQISQDPGVSPGR